MSEQEKYDELIRQKFAEKEFIFNEENWEKAEKMIDLSKKSKTVFWWSSIFLIGLITGLCIMFFIKKDNKQVLNAKNNKLIDSQIKEKNSTFQTQTAIGEASLEKNQIDDASSDSEPLANSTFSVSENSSATSMNEEKNKKDAADQTTQSLSLKATKKNANLTSHSRNKQNSSVKGKTKSRTDGNSEFSGSNDDGADFKPTSHNNALSAHKKIKKNKNKRLSGSTDPEADPEQELNEEELTENNTTKKADEIVAKKKEKSAKKVTASLAKKDIKKSQLAEKEGLEGDSLSLNEINDSAAFIENDPKQLVVSDSISDSVKLEIKKSEATDSIQSKADSLSKNKALEPLPMDGLASITLVTIDAGVNGQIGWQYADTVEGRGVTPIIGVGVTHWFNQKWSFYSGVQYGAIAYLKASVKKYTSTTYGFGSTTTETIIKPGILHYLVVPLTVQYHFNEKNAVFAGGNIGFLLNKKNKVELNYTHVAPLKSPTELAEQTTGSYYASSFNRLDAAIGVGYRRKISSHFTITAIANYGLLDIKKDLFFSQNKFERNSSLKLLLSYTIFDF